MKRLLLCGSAAVVLALVIAGCGNMIHGLQEKGGSSGSPPYVFTTPAIYREMVSLAGGVIIGSGDDGVFVGGRTVTLSAFKIATYETTYELWKEVRDWAATKGYTIVNEGYEGHEAAGTAPGTGTTNETQGWTAAQKKTRPVTVITWRDAIVWCNAYSEMDGKAPVYYYSGSIIKDSSDGTACDNAVMDTSKNGYRLPTEAEWEYAARGGNQSNGAVWAYTYAGTSAAIGDYAWYDNNSNSLGNTHKDYGAHPVGTKIANGANLYDMSGNVWEWCWDWRDTITTGTVTDPMGAASGSYRVLRGGGWITVASQCAVAILHHSGPDGGYSDLGFRVVCR